MNQRWSSNRYRRYPLAQQNPGLPGFGDGAIVDLAVRLREDLQGFTRPTVRLVAITADVANLTLRFAVASDRYQDVELVGTCAVTRADDTLVHLLVKVGGAPRPDLGYGRLVLGDSQEFPAWINITCDLAVDPSVVRLLPNPAALKFVVCNAVRPGATVVADGAVTTNPVVRIPEVVENETQRPYMHATEPTPQQFHVVNKCPAPELVGTAVPAPEQVPFVTQSVGSTTEVRDTTIATADYLPANPGYDAQVVGTVVSRAVVAGYNVDIQASVPNKTLRFQYRLGAGLGTNPGGVGLSPGLRSVQTIRRINGTRGRDGDFTISAGPGVMIVADAAAHALSIIFGAENVVRATS